MHTVAAIAIVLAAHVTGFINTAASYLGPIGTVISTVDNSITDTVNINNYIKTKRAAHKKVVKQ